MTMREYTKRAQDAFDNGRISADTYEVMIMNAELFVDEDDDYNDPRFPHGYAEIEYDDFDSEEAIIGARFDDLNYLRYFER